MTLDEMRKLHNRVKQKVKPSLDNGFYWISPEAVERVLTIGSAVTVEPPGFYIL
jgi:CRISPR-associated protein Cas2